MLLTIYDRHGKAKADVSANDSSTQQKEIQGDNVLSLSFSYYEHISLDVNDYTDFEGERYWLTERYAPAQKSDGEWDYNLKLYGIESLIRRFLVLETTDGNSEPVFTLTATPREHVAMIVKCINAGMGVTDWKVGQVDGTDLIVIDYEGKYCDEALKEIAGKVGGNAEWWVEGQTVNVCRCEHGEEITLGYGMGLTEIERDTSSKAKFYTRLFPIGSTRNIDPERYGHSRLMLPGGRQYVEVHTDEYGIYDHYEKDAFNGIYPRRTGTVSSVRSEDTKDKDGNELTIYYIKDDTLDFDPNDYELAEETKRISFQDGELAGLGTGDDHYFEVNFDSDTREFEIINIWPSDGTQIPGGQLVPKTGDKYILWNIRMPDEYYPAAETELQAAVDKYNAEHWLDISVYKAPTDHVWIEENDADLYVGRRVRLESEKYFPETGFRSSRIVKITRKVNLPSQMDIEISDALHQGTLEKVSDSIGELREYTRSRTEGMALPDIIRTGDSTRPTDNNLFSALRSLAEHLSKKGDDVAEGVIRFLKRSIHVDGAQYGKSFDPDIMTGFGGLIDGKGNGWLESLVVRRFAEFPEVRYNRAMVLLGDFWMAPGGGIIERVEPDLDATGGQLDSGTIWLKLEAREIGAVVKSDLCMGMFHDFATPENNATADTDDGRGNRTFSGFCTVYFKVDEIKNEDGNSDNRCFRYVLREKSERWSHSFHPFEMMHFVAFGNPDDKTRQNSGYITRKYARFLTNVTTWEFDENKIAMQWGDLSNLVVSGKDMSGYSAYLNNIYFTGTIGQLKNTARHMDIEQSAGGWLAASGNGAEETVTCTITDISGNDLTEEYKSWKIVRNSGDTTADNAWNNSHADIDRTFTIAYSDLNIQSDRITSVMFTVVAVSESAENSEIRCGFVVRRMPQDGTGGADVNPNILLRTVFNKGIDFVREAWTLDPKYTNIDRATDTVVEGRKCIRINASALNTFQDFAQDVYALVKPGTWYTLSFNSFSTAAWCTYIYSGSDSFTAIDRGAGIFVDGEQLPEAPINGRADFAAAWDGARHTVTFRTADTFNTTEVRIIFRAWAGSQVAICMPKLETGQTATVYMANEADLNGEDGADGANAVVLDLDNEADIMLYDSAGNSIGGGVRSQANLYDGTELVNSKVTKWEVEANGCTASIVNGLITVSAVNANVTSAVAQAKATYNGVVYKADFSVKRLVNADKYSLFVTPNAVSYNSTTGVLSASKVTIEVYKTGANGVTGKVSGELPSEWRITVDNNRIDFADGMATFNVSGSRTSYKIELRDDNNAVHDSETVPVVRTANGAKGDKGDDGADGTGISAMTSYYAISQLKSGVMREMDLGWKPGEFQQPTAEKPYAWKYTETTYTNGKEATYTDCELIFTYQAGVNPNLLEDTDFRDDAHIKAWDETERLWTSWRISPHPNDYKGGIQQKKFQGRNAFRGGTLYAGDKINYQNIIEQHLSGKLRPSTWYTLSYWLFTEQESFYYDPVTSGNYGFNQYKVYLISGHKYTFMIRGFRSDKAVAAGHTLRVYLYKSGWSWAKMLEITDTKATYASEEISDVPETGEYFVQCYSFPNDGNTSATVTIERIWLRDQTRHTTAYVLGDVVDDKVKGFVDGVEGTLASGGDVGYGANLAYTFHTYTFKTRSELPDTIRGVLFRLWPSTCVGRVSDGAVGGLDYTEICMPKLEEGMMATGYMSNEASLVGDVGDSGIDGCIQRVFYSDAYKAGDVYRNDSELKGSGLKYIDYMAEADSSMGTGWQVWQCKATYTAKATWAAERDANWTKVAINASSAFFTNLIAQNATVKLLTSAQVIATEVDGTPIAGLVNSDYPLWVGDKVNGKSANAPFRVNRAGKLFATGVEISGKITATEGTIGGFQINISSIGTDTLFGDKKKRGMYLSSKFIYFRDDEREGGIGCDMNINGVSRMLELIDNAYEVSDKNIALFDAQWAVGENIAIGLRAGCISGLAVQTRSIGYDEVVSASVPSRRDFTLNRAEACVIVSTSFFWKASTSSAKSTQNSDIYITLPDVHHYDFGHVIYIKRDVCVSSGKWIYIVPGRCYQWNDKSQNAETVAETVIVYNNKYLTSADPLIFKNDGDAAMLVYTRGTTSGKGLWHAFIMSI